MWPPWPVMAASRRFADGFLDFQQPSLEIGVRPEVRDPPAKLLVRPVVVPGAGAAHSDRKGRRPCPPQPECFPGRARQPIAGHLFAARSSSYLTNMQVSRMPAICREEAHRSLRSLFGNDLQARGEILRRADTDFTRRAAWAINIGAFDASNKPSSPVQRTCRSRNPGLSSPASGRLITTSTVTQRNSLLARTL